MKYWAWLLLLFTGTLHAPLRAQVQKPYPLRELQNRKSQALLPYMAYHASGTALPLDSITGKEEAAFRPAGKEQLNFGFTKDYHWFRFALRNNTGSDKRLFLLSENPALNRVALFRVRNGRHEALGAGGDHLPFATRPYSFYSFAVPFIVQKGRTDSFYLFIDKRNENLELRFLLFEENRFARFSQYVYLASGLLLGIILMSFLFHLFLWVNTLERLHLWYCLYSVSILSVVLAWKTLDFQFLFPQYPFWTNVSKYVTGNVSMIFILLIMQAYLGQTRANSRFFRAVQFMKWLLAVVAAAGVLVYAVLPYYHLKQLNHYGSFLLLLASFVLVYASCIEQYKKGYRLALIYMAAVSCLAVPVLLTLFYFLQKDLVVPFIQPTLIEIGAVLEALVICLAILYRYLLIRKKQQTLALEVQEQRSQMVKRVIAVQEQEQKRIAQDLHDELGGDLAAIKMSLQALPLQPERLVTLLRMIDKASSGLRNISHNLMPPEFAHTLLKEILRAYFQRLSTEGSTTFLFYYSGETAPFTKEEELILYRIIMELTNNILRHAEASEATVQLIGYEDKLELMVEDNGKGFAEGGTSGLGLKNIGSRVAYLEGTMNLDTSHRGTTVIIHVPYK